LLDPLHGEPVACLGGREACDSASVVLKECNLDAFINREEGAVGLGNQRFLWLASGCGKKLPDLFGYDNDEPARQLVRSSELALSLRIARRGVLFLCHWITGPVIDFADIPRQVSLLD